MLEHHFEHLEVSPDAVILVVAAKLGAERFVLLLYGFVQVFPAPLPYGFHEPPDSFSDRLPLYDPVTVERFGPEVGKPEKVECSIFLLSLLAR
jgi:hypothetical protein